jgi:ADP-ribose pyrophosphatase YjhB (NUDIX family)
MDNYSIRARVTGVLVENNRILLVKHDQPIDSIRYWSLPGGKLEQGETLEAAMKRELLEETGLQVKVERLLYVCEKPEEQVSRVHFLFQVARIGGELTLPTNEHDDNNIMTVDFVPLASLEQLHFSPVFMNLALAGFPNAGSYVGHKSNIGLSRDSAGNVKLNPKRPSPPKQEQLHTGRRPDSRSYPLSIKQSEAA